MKTEELLKMERKGLEMGMTAGELLKMERENRGLTVEKLAARSGVCPSTISNVERGKTTNPGIETLRLMAAGMGLPVMALVPECRENLVEKHDDEC